MREYVIVDRFKRKVLVLSRKANEYEEHELKPGDVYRTVLLPGLSVAIDEVFDGE